MLEMSWQGLTEADVLASATSRPPATYANEVGSVAITVSCMANNKSVVHAKRHAFGGPYGSVPSLSSEAKASGLGIKVTMA
ncbi:hypothetical protein N7539_003421 [Penicillium diatomitis]|uniref:Uncharacterized protein n=1 Tax=Penicillium diatomitis TaxID=2819901 RepID=A0A9X0BX95_9EURO|nr:uncharacterized protein N7539_003421 [Penicillium diatomitis]KAJ5488531.1 hypothetical protein N7539_003421 [Penicillium diatomitis]